MFFLPCLFEVIVAVSASIGSVAQIGRCENSRETLYQLKLLQLNFTLCAYGLLRIFLSDYLQ